MVSISLSCMSCLTAVMSVSIGAFWGLVLRVEDGDSAIEMMKKIG